MDLREGLYIAEKTLGDYSIGHLRIKYLDLANISFAQNNYTIAKGYIDDFLDTIDETTTHGKNIKTEFDKIHARKKHQLGELEKSVQSLGYLEQKDISNDGRESIEINCIHDMKEVCWRIALANGLFNE